MPFCTQLRDTSGVLLLLDLSVLCTPGPRVPKWKVARVSTEILMFGFTKETSVCKPQKHADFKACLQFQQVHNYHPGFSPLQKCTLSSGIHAFIQVYSL